MGAAGHDLAALGATRALLRAPDAAAAQEAVLGLCRDLGIEVAAPDTGGVPFDLGLGELPPVVPVPRDDVQRELVRRYVVPLVEDARVVVHRMRAQQHLSRRAALDPLTGTWNRASLMHALSLAQPGDCVALVDLDHFKDVNDTWGHAAGDEVLVVFARHLRSSLRERDIVGRYGGEEFAMLLREVDVHEGRRTVERLRREWPDASPRRTTFSAGVAAVVPVSADRVPGVEALATADHLMYAAKSEGRDRVHVAEAS